MKKRESPGIITRPDPAGSALGLPFGYTADGRTAVATGDDAIAAKIVQVLFTEPGERVGLPDFGCGLGQFVFEADNDMMATWLEFTIRQALMTWLADDISVDAVEVRGEVETITVEIVYTRLRDFSRQALRLNVGGGSA